MQHDEPNIDYQQRYDEQVVLTKEYSTLIEEQSAVIQKQLTAMEAMRDRIEPMSAELAQLRRMIFGVRHERFVPAAEASAADLQLALDLTTETVAHCKLSSATTVVYVRATLEVTPVKPKTHAGRNKLPGHLRRETILLKPDIDVSGLQRMGEEVTEVLDYIPAELYVKQCIRPKYIAPLGDGSTVLTASLPGSHEAAQRAAMMYSLLATCKLHNIHPYYWLRDVLEHIHLFTTKNIEELLPQNWKKLPL